MIGRPLAETTIGTPLGVGEPEFAVTVIDLSGICLLDDLPPLFRRSDAADR